MISSFCIAMARSRIYISAVTILLLGFGIGSVLLMHRSQYRFLQGHPCTGRVEGELPGDIRFCREFYSFQADYNDICEKASAELTTFKFKEDPDVNAPGYERAFTTRDTLIILTRDKRVFEGDFQGSALSLSFYL